MKFFSLYCLIYDRREVIAVDDTYDFIAYTSTIYFPFLSKKSNSWNELLRFGIEKMLRTWYSIIVTHWKLCSSIRVLLILLLLHLMIVGCWIDLYLISCVWIYHGWITATTTWTNTTGRRRTSSNHRRWWWTTVICLLRSWRSLRRTQLLLLWVHHHRTSSSLLLLLQRWSTVAHMTPSSWCNRLLLLSLMILCWGRTTGRW
mmetsp:Transcript_7921/g.8781  ORF Transcript_7921/g.8781 Transcript_7921/m.8781 type:complete len:202 (-) Transcript_7921:196-801(-)